MDLIERYLQLECGDAIRLSCRSVGKGQQVNALNIEWFEIERVTTPRSNDVTVTANWSYTATATIWRKLEGND